MEGGTYPAALLPDGSVAVMSGAVEGPRAPYPWTVYRLDPSGQWIQPALTNSPPMDWGYPPGLIMTLRWAGFWGKRPVDWTREAALTPQRWMPSGSQRPPIESDPFWQWVEAPTARQAAIVFKSLFEEVPIEICRYAARLPDGGTILAISEGTPMRARSRLMRFDRDWRPDLSFATPFEADYRSWLTLKRLRDGKFLFAGVVGKIGEEEFPGIVRLETNGVIDRTFHCETSRDLSGRIFDFAVQPDDRIIICGDFAQVDGTPVPHLARLNSDGSLDSTFKPPFLSLKEVDRRRLVRVTQLSRKARATTGNPGANAAGTAASAATSTAPSAEMVLIVSMAKAGAAAIVQFTGLPGQSYILQANESMIGAQWKNVSTNQTSATGAGSLRDVEAEKYPIRFYRIARP